MEDLDNLPTPLVLRRPVLAHYGERDKGESSPSPAIDRLTLQRGFVVAAVVGDGTAQRYAARSALTGSRSLLRDSTRSLA